MSEPTHTSANSKWVYVVIGLVAIIGLLAGLLISKSTAPVPVVAGEQTQFQVPPNTGPRSGPGAQDNPNGTPNDVRRILRKLAPERRREIMQQAIKNADIAGQDRSRELFIKRRELRQAAIDIARAEPFDENAMRKALDDVQQINAKLAAQGTDLTIEVLQLMTSDERKAAATTKRQERRERRRERRNNKN